MAAAGACSATSPCHHVPQDLIFSEILPRLPTKSIWRFRSVCESWHAVISEGRDDLAVNHWRRSTGAATTMTISSLSGTKIVLVPTAAASRRRRRIAFSRRPPDGPGDATMSILSTSHGIVLYLVTYSTSRTLLRYYNLCNPLLGRVGERISICPWFPPNHGVVLRSTALAFDPHVSTTHFKLVQPIQRELRIEEDRQRWGFGVFDSRTGEWTMTHEEKDLVHPPIASFNPVVLRNGIYAGGVLYWNIQYSGCLLSFDPWQEIAALVPSPDMINHDISSFIGVQQDGRLTYMALEEFDFKSWVLLKDGRRSWESVLNVDLFAAISGHWRFFYRWPFTFDASPRFGGFLVLMIWMEYIIECPSFCSENKVYLRFIQQDLDLPESENFFLLCYHIKEDRWTAFSKRFVGRDPFFYFCSSLLSPPKCKI